MQASVTEDAMKARLIPLSLLRKLIQHRHLRADDRSVALGQSSQVRPHISLKARMLGGQAETIRRLGGSLR